MKKPLSPTLKASSPPRYTVKLTRTAQKQLDKLPKEDNQRITAALLKLETEPRPFGVKKLKGSEDYRIRIGDYRVQYSIFDNVLLIEIVKVGQRGNFYDE